MQPIKSKKTKEISLLDRLREKHPIELGMELKGYISDYILEGTRDQKILVSTKSEEFLGSAATIKEALSIISKFEDWEHEKEWRIVHVSFREDNFPENRILKYNIDALSGIIFGMRTAQKVKRRVYNIVRKKSKKICFYDAILLDGSFQIIPADENQLEES